MGLSSRDSDNGQRGFGVFNNSKDFVVTQPTLIEGQIIQNFAAGTGEQTCLVA